MSHNWGPYYIVPSDVLKSYSGTVVLREQFDEELLRKELQSMGVLGPIVRITNPWYYRMKKTDTWIKIGESADEHQNFPTRWDTTSLKNGQYEVMGLMHVFVKRNGAEIAIARQNIVEITVEN
jgi:small-conductance mechanosensitive channel